MRLEGIVSKRATSPYRDGKRTDDWQQVKFAKSETFVIGGWHETGGYMHTVSASALPLCGASSNGIGPLSSVSSPRAFMMVQSLDGERRSGLS